MGIFTYSFLSKHENVAKRLANHLTNLINEVRPPIRKNLLSLFNSDIANLLLNINKGRNKRPNFVIFVVWYTLIVGGLVSVGVLVAWSIKYCSGPAEIASFVSRFYSKMRDAS